MILKMLKKLFTGWGSNTPVIYYNDKHEEHTKESDDIVPICTDEYNPYDDDIELELDSTDDDTDEQDESLDDYDLIDDDDKDDDKSDELDFEDLQEEIYDDLEDELLDDIFDDSDD